MGLNNQIKMVPSQAIHREYYNMFYRDIKLLCKFIRADVKQMYFWSCNKMVRLYNIKQEEFVVLITKSRC